MLEASAPLSATMAVSCLTSVGSAGFPGCVHQGAGRLVAGSERRTSSMQAHRLVAHRESSKRVHLGFQWRIYAQRITPSVKKKHVKKMKKAGLVRVTFGVESFSDRIRRDMGKVVSDSITDRVLKEFVDQGIKVSLLLIYGYPIETDEDFDKTLAWVRKNGRRFSHICFSCFVVTNEYCEKRPGIVTFEEEGWHPYKWHSEIVGREKRIERFLKLVDVLADLDVEFMISDPHVNRYYREWNETTKKEFESEFNRSHENSPEESK